MTTIKVTPEQLLAVSRQFEAAQNQIYQMNNNLKQRMFEIERVWDGSTKENFYADFTHAQRVMDNFVTLSMSISKELRSHSEKFRMADSQTVQSYDPRCAPPPPDECRAPAADPRNAFQKSADSLVELGQAFMQSADDRYQKRYDSVGGFLDYWTFGIPSGLVQGYVDRANKAFDSPNDTANWLTFGIHGTIREATFPTNAWSSEHWANIFGVGGLMLGGGYASTMIKPHNLFTSTGGGAKINSFSRPGTGNMTGGFHGFQDQRLRITENIAESKKARESSKFSEFVEKEKEIVKETVKGNWNLDDLQNTEAFKKGTTSNALNHIFEGELIKGQAVGFHYEGMPNSKGKIVGNVDPPNEYGVYRANIEVDGVLKKAKTTFFPKDWTSQQVIDEINIAFDNKVVFKNNRYRGTASTGMNIEFVVKNGKITSAYPLY
ncbi:WXG100 family type VII secretion target [Paenibacillus illinoisensis]|uniref:Bacterial EndoU nuclease domain-containing protein n=1 Tax=Paenibacillus illinoisensis TaxID=59845 RepID=A0A2W0CSR5_9BACL|nr:WXG100 family type VII secretion target [Paenibacillus illinoisensis]PYY31215.1 Uncharacterized protein PIL02S_00306 [Paenibacillus illinoisensis]